MELTSKTKLVVDVRGCSISEKLDVVARMNDLGLTCNLERDDIGNSTHISMNFHRDYVGHITSGSPTCYGQLPILSCDEFMAIENNTPPKGREDAYIYIKGGHAFLKFWDPHSSQELTGKIEDAHLFNLMSEEEFKAKHQPKLKFKGWGVKRYYDDREAGEMIKVGCEKFSVHELTVFCHMTRRIRKHAALREAWEFIDTHKKELGL